MMDSNRYMLFLLIQNYLINYAKYLQEIIGKISFRGVHFSYPTRRANKILNNMNFTIEPGKTLALVGESGCGKSTVISLLERFYNPSSGIIVSS